MSLNYITHTTGIPQLRKFDIRYYYYYYYKLFTNYTHILVQVLFKNLTVILKSLYQNSFSSVYNSLKNDFNWDDIIISSQVVLQFSYRFYTLHRSDLYSQ
jgi:hypothetical protein